MNNFDSNLDRISNLLQILSFQILVEDFNNTDLMKYLAHQDDLLDRIIEQNEEILNTPMGQMFRPMLENMSRGNNAFLPNMFEGNNNNNNNRGGYI